MGTSPQPKFYTDLFGLVESQVDAGDDKERQEHPEPQAADDDDGQGAQHFQAFTPAQDNGQQADDGGQIGH